MQHTFLFAQLFFLLLILLPLLILFIAWRKRGRMPRAGGRHPLVRAVCGLLALVLVLAVVAGTWRATSPDYDTGHLSGLLVPTVPSGLDERTNGREQAPERLIFTTLVVVPESGGPVPYDGDSVMIELPRDLNEPIQIEGLLPGGIFNAEIQIESMRAPHAGRLDGSLRVARKFGSRSSGRSSGIIPALGEIRTQRVGINQNTRHWQPLSVVPSTEAIEEVWILTHLAAVDKGDVERISAFDWLQKHPLPQDGGLTGGGSSRGTISGAPPGIKTLLYAGPSVWLLILAAALAAQAFVRPGLAFTVGIGFMVILLGALDRAMVERHAARLGDPDLQPAERDRIEWRVSGSFFHQERARAVLEKQQPSPAQ